MEHLLSGAVILLLLPACTTDAPEASLPAATQEGKNTGGCLIDGKAFVATGWPSNSILGSGPTPPLYGGFYEDSLYYVELTGSKDGQRAEVSLFLRSRSSGTYQFNQLTPTLYRGGLRHTLAYASFRFADNSSEVYITDPQHTGSMTLTRATLSTGISAGTFEFTAASTLDPRKTITITQGRFDRQQ